MDVFRRSGSFFFKFTIIKTEYGNLYIKLNMITNYQNDCIQLNKKKYAFINSKIKIKFYFL